MEGNKFSFPVIELLPPFHIIEGSMGYSEGETPGPVSEILSQVLDEARSFPDARAEYVITDNLVLGKETLTASTCGITFNVKKIIGGQLKNSESLALFICTAGHLPGERSRYYMKTGDLLTGYIYDLVGSEIAEAAADRIQNEILTVQAAKGMGITNRYSPGYCGWDVSEQHLLFSFFKENYCGITLTESALMNPVKSVSGIIGTGRGVQIKPYQCRVCSDKNCLYRNRKVH